MRGSERVCEGRAGCVRVKEGIRVKEGVFGSWGARGLNP